MFSPEKLPETLFDRLLREEREAVITYPPSNAFQEMSRWTKQGKMWTYPIDNEAGINYYISNHDEDMRSC